MARVRSKHSNLLNYFIHDKRDLSPAYVRKCEHCGSWFAEEQKPMRFELQDSAKDSPIGKASKPEAPSRKLQAASNKLDSD